MPSKKTYIGDSVYAEIDPQRITLTTDNGRGETNRIVLEGTTFSSLLRFAQKGWDISITVGPPDTNDGEDG